MVGDAGNDRGDSMKEPRLVADAVRAPQIRASNPDISAFVSANAGAGKTHVLVSRVIRLLLKDTPPEKILCITFTKAAAANMAERVFDTLGHWITLDDTELDRQLVLAGVARPDARTRARARQLFSSALETPGGLKVQTIHALCTRLLQQFPFEANVPARFTVLDDRDQFEIMERASLAVLLDAAANPQSATGRALTTAITSAADRTFREVVNDACLGGAGFLEWVADGAPRALAQLHAALGLNGDEQLADVERDMVDGPHMPRAEWPGIAAALDDGSKTDQQQAATLRAAHALSGAEQVEAYLSVFLTQTTKEFRKSFVTQRVLKNHPAVAAAFDREAARIAVLVEKRRAVAVAERSRALVQIAAAVSARYVREKQERGLLDYDDLIDRTLAMLRRTTAGWVHYKLDQGVDHVLVDEAQDTSPRQWEIISHIVEDFASGAGARGGMTRTIFAVGDEKQSIFSFQGAAPHEFDRWHRQFRRTFGDAGLVWDKDIRLSFSFRSGLTILNAVDEVFKDEAIYKSIHTAANGRPLHEALSDAPPGIVELWDLAEADDRQVIDGWSAPFDAVSETSAEAKLAARITRTIKEMIDRQEPTGRADRRRPLRPGDILILVRRRGKLFDAVLQALKRAHVPVAGADRLKLTEHIAIIDLMNLADAILLPSDDLALAVALKSPLFGISEEQLFMLAQGRKGRRLRTSLAEHARTDVAFKAAYDRLRACEAKASSVSPFAFYSWLLGSQQGRSQILGRLSHEATDALDEFLELALRFEQREPASLQGFMAWLRATDVEIKRDMEISRDEVRVMTVHGAKGLEAPVVFLVDTTSTPLDNVRLSLIRFQSASDTAAPPNCVVWAGRKADDPVPVRNARQRMVDDIEHEYRRLLYVAMTRAAERLIVGGVQPGNRNEVPPNSWYRLIASGLENSNLTEQSIETRDGVVRRYTRPQDVFAPSAAAQPLTQAQLALTPHWLHQKASPPIPAFELKRPSDASDDEGHPFKRGQSVRDRQHARRRGVLVHRLLESLPDIASERRREAADRYMARNAADWPESEREGLVLQTIGLLADPRFAALFATGSRAEVPLVGRLARPGRAPLVVSGQIDRLIMTEQEILIADYKTNHAPPSDLAGVPPAYRQQLALYRALLMRLYSGKVVRAALVWTEAPEIMEIPSSVLDDEMRKIISP
jgi:ATP-dependent helicase/nuclease subunit A